MKEQMKRWVSLLLAVVMVFTMLPQGAIHVHAEEEDGETAHTEGNAAISWEGRSAVFVGDSITAGSGTTKIYYEYLEESLGLGSVTAMGVPGSCVSAASDYGQSNQPLINRYQSIPSADLILVFMGTNDYGHETPLGSVADAQDGTFYGALNVIVPALVSRHSSSKIVFVTPLRRYGFGTSKILGTKFTYDSVPNGVGATLGDYVDALKTVCANNGVSVIDLYTECTLDPADATVSAAYMPDGLHPNAAGHEIIAGIMESHIRNFEPVEQEPVVQTEMVYGNKFVAGKNETCRISSRVNYYLKAGTVITLKDSAAMQWACAKTSNENSSNNLGYFPDSAWSDKQTAVVAEDGWVGFTFKYRDETQAFDVSKPLSDYITIEAPHTHTYKNGICANCGMNVRDDADYTHAIPENQGVQNAIDRAYSLTDVEWTPLANVPGVKKINGEFTVVPFEAGKTYRGIPYSGVTANDCYVGLNVSLESFMTALENENSVLYTENLFSTNPKSATYFGTVCSKFAQYALDVPGSYNTNNVANIPGMETIALPGQYTVDQIKLGDVVLHTRDHTTICTDILYDADGNVAFIEISEAVLPLCRRMYWSPEEFYEHFEGYRLCRYQYIDQTPAIGETELTDDYALMPRFGDKYNYKVSSTKGIVDILESGYSTAVVIRDGKVIDRIVVDSTTKTFKFDCSVPGHIEMYLEKADGTRSGSVYANVVKSSVSVNDSSEFARGKLTVTIDGSSGTPLYVQVGSAHAIFCNVEGRGGTVEITFPASKISTRQVRVAYQNEYGIYLSKWVSFTADANPSKDPLLSQGQYWNGYNITPSSPTPVIQEGKDNYWSYTMIPVEENTTYYSLGATRLWYLDANGEGISTLNAYKDSDIPYRFTTPAGTAYVSIAYSPNLLNQGEEKIEKISADVDDGNDEEDEPIPTNPSTDPYLSRGEYWDGYTLTPSSSSPVIQSGKESYWTYAMVPVEGNTTYYSAGANRMWFFDANKKPISTYNAITDSDIRFQFMTPANARFVSVTYAPSVIEKGTEKLTKCHTYTPTVTAPTCTEQGYTTYTCACGDSYVDDYVEALGHNYTGLYCGICGEKNPDAADCPEDPASTGWPTINTDLSHIICYGQSFSVGSDAPYYADPTVDGVYVFGSITNSSNGTELRPLSASAGNQHAIISAGNALAQMLTAGGYDTDLVLGSYGSGGRTVAQLMSKERQEQIKAEEGYTYDCLSSGRYEVFEKSVDALAKYAETNGQSVSCPVIVYLQGETDQNTDQQLGYPDNPNRAGYGAGGDKEKYKEYMTRLKNDMQQKVMEAYGQTEKPLFVIYQVSGTYVRTQYSSINMAQIEFAQENDDVILVQTPYFTSHYTNSHHLTQNGYRWLGEYIAKYVYTALDQRVKPWPMLPESIEVTGKNTVRITVRGAQNGLAIDTWTVENASNSKNLYGFYLESNGKLIVPKEVSVHENIIELTLPANLASETVYVYYAGRHASGTGNIRDNCSDVGFYEYLDDSNDTGTGNNQGVSHSSLDANGNSIIGQKYPMYNWLASFCYEVEVPEPEQRQAAYYHWEMQSDGLLSVNDGNSTENILTLVQGAVTDGALNKVQYTMEKEIVLEHDRPWVIEWKAAGNGNGYYGGKFLNSTGSDSHAQYLYIPADSRGMVAWGVSSDSANYGFQLNKMGIDYRKEHTYRIENRIANDGVNTVYLIVDGVEIGAMTTGYRTSANSSGSAGSMIEEPKNWANGKDIFVNGIGAGGSFLLNNMKLSYLKVWENGQHTHAYEAAVTAPTCTEKGYTTYTCACGDSYVADYVNAKDHIYENGVCVGCGAEHPNLANYKGKVISILSASTSTFAGYIPTADGFNLEHRSRYPQDNLLTDVNETWWMQVINELDAKLGINDSWAGSQVLNTRDTNSGDLGPDAAMASLTRIQNLGANGTPDLILFFGGGNDMGRGVTLGSFDPATAPTEVDLTTKKWDSFADAYVAAIMRLQYFYPDTEIVVMTTYPMPSYVTAAKLNKYGPVIKAICDHYGVKYVDMRDCGLTFDMLPDNIHPNAEGMDYITADVLDTLLNRVEMEAGENVVHSVAHNLTNAEASRHYYKGISSGSVFEETLSGEDLSVTVTMGGRDITASVYADGKIHIPAVTGDVVITAAGRYNVDGHLQQLPENVCPGVNLWTTLDPENIYYTATGWGNTTAGTTWSITFPVKEGDRIWATSLGAYPENGSSANGVRVTWFDASGVLVSMSREAVYAEFAKNGYITAPKGAVALNVPMTNNQEHYAVYILSAEHTYKNGICTGCGAEEPVSHIPGDITGDGVVNNKDYTRLFRYLSGYDVEVVEAALDVNGDGVVNNKDYTRLFRYLSGHDVTIH